MILKRRKSTRLQTWDYHERGPYFVTFCTHHREPLFLSQGVRSLVIETIRAAAGMYRIRIHAAVVAEDHVHGLLTLPDGGTTTLGNWVGFLKREITKRVGAASTPSGPGALEGAPTREVWQRSFYDHVIRNEEDFAEKARYIENHPLKESSVTFAEWH